MQEDSGPVPSTERSRPGSGGGMTQHSSAPPSTNGANDFLLSPPAVSLPKGGGAVRGIGEKFSANPVTGTGAMSIPIALSPGRGGFGPKLALNYDSGAGQSVFGLGWNLALPSIVRKTDKGLPRYLDGEESDVFMLSGAEDLVPVIDPVTLKRAVQQVRLEGILFNVHRYRPRIEGLFALIERWTSVMSAGTTFWRTISRDNVTTWYGRDDKSQIFDPSDPSEPSRIFQWLICQTNDDKGNVAVYEYVDDKNLAIDTAAVWETNRDPKSREANRYLKRIRYGNPPPSYLPKLDPVKPDELPQEWMFEAVFDYGDHVGEFPTPEHDDPPTPPRHGPPNPRAPVVRPDPFSSHRSGFEVRNYRLCRRVLMFHHFADAPGVGLNCLVRSTDFEYELAGTTSDPTKPSYSMLRSVTQWSFQSKPEQSTEPGSVREYESRQLPPVVFTYSQPVVNQVAKSIDATELENLPVGTQGPGYRWIDLDGEGLSGVLTEATGAWYYKPGLGDGKFGPVRAVARVPAMALAGGSRHQFMDLAGDGEIDVVDFGGPTPGFHERDGDEGWKRHVPFASLPNINWQDPNLRFVDLTGDGHADALITEQDVFTWHPSLDERGFDAAERTRQQADEDAGPKLIFADGTQTIFLADMCGDGLTDLVRIRSGEVCYWPNQGYGRFGRRVTLGNSPHFDSSDLFDPSRIRLTDIDGSGPIDIIYLGREGAQLYFNRAGNSLSNELTVELPVATENLGAVQVADLLGNGTACLVWNSHLPAAAGRPVHYIDLMGGKAEAADEHRLHEKPHLLVKVDNNLGATTDIEYTPSTRFYLQDKERGTPWITRLPFPVHCVSRVTSSDLWRGTKFSNTYSYHHGHFDGVEREFRGFGRVEQVDVEDLGKFAAINAGNPWVTGDQRLYQPPVKTITWFHTGAALDRQRILRQFAQEYFPKRFADRLPNDPAAFHEKPLADPELPDELSADEWREALRACKGMTLRQEVYELDIRDLTGNTPKHTPLRLFSAATHNCHVAMLQPRADNLHAVFLVTESEALSYHYELAIPKDQSPLRPDPRIAHTLTLRTDDLGNPQQSVAVGYPRWTPADFGDLPRPGLIKQVQAELHVAYTETRYTKEDVVLPKRADPPPLIDLAIRHHRLRLPYEVLTYELAGIPKAGPRYYELSDFRTLHLSDAYGLQLNAVPPPPEVHPKQYHEVADGAELQKRIVEHARTRFFNDLADDAPVEPLDFGSHGPRGLKYEDYRLALTRSLLDAVFRQSEAGQVEDRLDWEALPGQRARLFLDNWKVSGFLSDAQPGLPPTEYWMRSGNAGFADGAHDRFFLPTHYKDPFDNPTKIEYDKDHCLFVCRVEDAKKNSTYIVDDAAPGEKQRLRFDYRVLAPLEMVDINGNRSEVVFDVRGLPVAMAVKGKKQQSGSWEGDHLDGWNFNQINVPESDVVNFCIERSFDQTEGVPRGWLSTATARFVYHFGQSLDDAGQPVWLQRMPGACAIVREIHTGQPGGDASPIQISLECSDGGGAVFMKKQQAEPAEGQTDLRWIVNGLTILNNKGKPVRQYEPDFSATFGCEVPQANGVSTTTYYDAVGRPVRVEMPDGTFSRVEFSPWFSRSFDANDTVLESAWYAVRVNPPADAPVDENGARKRAALLAAKHANTPAEVHFDSLGRDVIAIAHNRTDGVDTRYLTYTKLDAEGKPLWIRDARDNLVMQYIIPPKKTRLADENNEEMPADSISGTKVYSAPCYDIAGNLLHQHSMDAGDRWMLMDAAGKPMLAWDFNDVQDYAVNFTEERRLYFTEYDALHRPTRQWLNTWSRPRPQPGSAGAAFTANPPEQIERFVYRDAVANGAANLNGQITHHYDPSGLVQSIFRDFKGNVQEVRRRLVDNPRTSRTDWTALTNVDGSDKLESETYVQITEHDALGRMVRLFNWHRADKPVAVYEPKYNERGLLESELIQLHATKKPGGYDPEPNEPKPGIQNIRYNAKGQKEKLELCNGTVTEYEYDSATFRVRQIFTSLPPPKKNFPAYRSHLKDDRVFQQLLYTCDPVGNITEVEDQAYKPVYFSGDKVEPRSLYEYDALYRLTKATGRETAEGAAAAANGSEPAYGKGFPVTDQTLRTYTQGYEYDKVGNFLSLNHGVGQSPGGWTRAYEPDKNGSNRLLKTQQGNAEVLFKYDPHGSMLNLAKVEEKFFLRWDHRDMIRFIDLGGGGQVWYQYDSGKQRTRKFIQRTASTREERVYLGGMERFRRWTNDTVIEEIETLHLFEGEQRVLMVDDVNPADPTPQDWNDGRTLIPQTLLRYQYGNHLGSVAAELDQTATVISYEEFHPYGTSACRAIDAARKAPARRYRYCGMERDDELGLGYHSARFYSGALARWCSADPSSIRTGLNVFAYVDGNPVRLRDDSGREGKTSWWEDMKAQIKVEAALLPRQVIAPFNILNPNGLKEVQDLRSRATELIAKGQHERALEVATGFEEYFDIHREGKNVGSPAYEQGAVMVGHATGFNQTAVAVTGESRSGAKLSLGERAWAAVDGGLRLLNTVSTVAGGVEFVGTKLGALNTPRVASPSNKDLLRAAYRGVVAKEVGEGSAAFTKIDGMRMKSWASEVLVGTSPEQFRKNALKLIQADPNHPLRVLLDKSGNFRNSTAKGVDLVDKMFDPRLAEAGHVFSDFAVASDKQMVIFMSAYENQFISNTAETGLKAAQLSNRIAVNFGGVGLSESYAKDLADMFPQLRALYESTPRIVF